MAPFAGRLRLAAAPLAGRPRGPGSTLARHVGARPRAARASERCSRLSPDNSTLARSGGRELDRARL
jgi:hypothetical protein